ncbi:MAG TPA: sulfite exporter TauE/SafE family protein [Methylomirabilota bacterium]|nr:sulfite exporter TauE/SafE family protein [Methylomirabilota bacterium]
MITDPLFYALAIPAVAFTGLSKGALGGAFGFAAVPALALVLSPIQAAALMLPILLVMDVVAVSSFRRLFDRRIVLKLLPYGLLGTALGWATASLVSDDAVRVVVGGIALIFLLRVFLNDRKRKRAALGAAVPDASTDRRGMPKGALIWGTLAGYTSFVAHAGGPPYQAYVVPIRLEPVIYAGTSAIFFAILNAVKVIPYAALGQFDTTTLSTAAALFPLAIVSTWIGVKVVRVIGERVFYRILYVSIAMVSVKLIYDGVNGLIGG